MTERIDYQNQEDYEAVQQKRKAELRAFHDKAIADSNVDVEHTLVEYPNPNPGTKPVEGVDEQPNAEQKIEEATPAEQEEAVEKAEEREAEVHPPIEEPEETKEEEKEEEKPAPKPEKETAAQKKAREAKEAKETK